MIVLQIILCVFICNVLLLCESSSLSDAVIIDLNPTTTTATNIVESYTISRNTKQIFCYQSKHKLLSSYHLYHIFHEISIVVTERHSKIFSWHAINGVSTDDFHTNLNTFIHYLFDKIDTAIDSSSSDDDGRSSGDDGSDNADVDREPYEQESFIRDILSACPSPLFTSHRSQCLMKFSSVGKSCVSIKAHDVDYDYIVSISIMHQFNRNLVYNLIAGLVLITFAGLLAKSKVFQVISIYIYIYIVIHDIT